MLERFTKRRSGLRAGSAIVALCATAAAGCSSGFGAHDPHYEFANCDSSPSTVRVYVDPHPSVDKNKTFSFGFQLESKSSAQAFLHIQNGQYSSDYDFKTMAAGTKVADVGDGAAAIVAGEDINGIWKHSDTAFTLFCYEGANLLQHPSDISRMHIQHVDWTTVEK